MSTASSPALGKHDDTIGGRAKGLTAKELACIHLRLPRSDTLWLDQLIKEAIRNDFIIKKFVYDGEKSIEHNANRLLMELDK